MTNPTPTLASRLNYCESAIDELAELLGILVEHVPDAAAIVDSDGRRLAERVAELHADITDRRERLALLDAARDASAAERRQEGRVRDASVLRAVDEARADLATL